MEGLELNIKNKKINLNSFSNKKVLITGHSGFKGSWLSKWLIYLGAKVYGISDEIPTKPSMFKVLGLESSLKTFWQDVSDKTKLDDVLNKISPDYIFHLAAQPIVSISYNDPYNTIKSNVMGTVSLLEVLRNYKKRVNVVFITSDKTYDNVEQLWGYRENDKLGGKDVYSGSKASSDILIRSYFDSFISSMENINIGIGRAGNVIGGGDWAKDRLIVDCFKSWSKKEKITIRSPLSTRPWQHVLEPLSGYITLALNLELNPNINGEAFNFGPNSNLDKTVLSLVKDLGKRWSKNKSLDDLINIKKSNAFKEAGLLKLNCDKALALLNWTPTLNYKKTIDFTVEWYKSFYNKSKDLNIITQKQIEFFIENFKMSN